MTLLSTDQIEGPALAPGAQLPGLLDGKLPRRLAIASLILLFAFLSLYPMAMLLYGSLHSTPPGMAGDVQSRRLRSAGHRRERRLCW